MSRFRSHVPPVATLAPAVARRRLRQPEGTCDQGGRRRRGFARLDPRRGRPVRRERAAGRRYRHRRHEGPAAEGRPTTPWSGARRRCRKSLETLRRTTEQRRTEREQANEAAKSTLAAISADVPKMVQAIQGRVDVLAKSKKLPKNLDKAKFESARADFEQMKTTWSEATAAASAGNAVEAVSRGEAAKSKGTDVMLAPA